MTSLPATNLPELCRSALQVGVGALIQSTLLAAAGLLWAAVLRRRGPTLTSAIYRATLAGVAIASVLSVGGAGILTPLWRVNLPSVPEPARSGPPGRATPPPVGASRADAPRQATQDGTAVPQRKHITVGSVQPVTE